MHANRFHPILICLYCATGVAAAPSYADEPVLEEVIVTARYREESLQDVPLSETAFTEQQIEDARIDHVDDFISLTPNVTLVQSQNAGTSFMTIRGITQVRNGEPPVATVVDGVLQVSPNQFAQELFDIESIEVVRGPQGALYGRNATGGAIIINTRQPTDDFESSVRVGYGDGDEILAQASFSGPLVEDSVYFRAGLRYNDRDGYFDNIYLDEKVDYLKDTTFRGMLKFQGSENFTADLHLNLSRYEGGAAYWVYQPTVFADDGVSLGPGDFPFDFSQVDANNTSVPFTANNLGFNDRDIDEIALKMDFDLGGAILTSTTSWNSLEEFFSQDQFPYTASTTTFNAFGMVDGTATQYLDVDAWSQEFRISSDTDEHYNWMFGAYYLQTDRFISTVTGDDQGLGILRVERTPAPPGSINPTTAFFADDNDNTAWALFGQYGYQISDQWEFSLAARYDKDEREQHVSPEFFGGLGEPGAVNSASFDKLQPKITVTYRPEEHMNLYFSWGQGFRSGQFNQNGVSEGAADFGLPGLSDIAGPEETETYEIGFKSELLDRRLRLNAAIFSTEVDGMHYYVFVGPLTAQVLENIDQVQLLGGELELVAAVADGFDLYMGVGITDSEIEEYARVPSDVGNKAPYIPDYTFNLGGQYRTPITESLGLFARADYERRGEQYWDPENTTAREPLDLLDLRLGVESEDGKWSLIGTVKNALDEEYNSEFVGGGFSYLAFPRTWIVDFSYKF